MDMQERFTDRVRKVMNYARQEAIRLHHDYIGTEHILLGIVKEGEGVAAVVLTNLGINLDDLRRAVENAVPTGFETLVLGDVPLNQEAKSALNYAVDEARKMNHTYVGTEHLLLGLLREEHGIACQVLQSLGVDIELVRQETIRLLSGDKNSTGTKGKSRTPALDYFSRDLTQLAREEKLDPIIGREKEIERIIQILARRKKKQPSANRRSRRRQNCHCRRSGTTDYCGPGSECSKK